MLLTGSRAAKIHWSDFRDAKDWDLIASSEEVRAHFDGRFDLVAEEPHKRFYRGEQGTFEVSLTDERPMLKEATALASRRVAIAGVGMCDVASAHLLFVLKWTFLAYPVHWYKSMRDLAFMKARTAPLPAAMVAYAARLMTHVASLDYYRRALAPGPIACCHDHPAMHAHVMRRWPKSAARAEKIDWVAEETAAVAFEQLLRARAPSERARIELRARDWALRLLITRLMPLGWRYFAADAYDEIRARLGPGWWRAWKDWVPLEILPPRAS